jgi:hypothetical protein
MPYFPQYQNAVLVEWANYVTTVLTGSTGATISANAGDCQIIEVNAVNVSGTAKVTLPSVALGGPVLVKFASTAEGTAHGTAAVVTIIPQVVDTVAGCKIDGFGSITLTALGDTLVLASDGTNWWAVNKFINSIETW